jgi:hypothetical protein
LGCSSEEEYEEETEPEPESKPPSRRTTSRPPSVGRDRLETVSDEASLTEAERAMIVYLLKIKKNIGKYFII